MELPLGGPVLRHYTQSRPRPHRQKLNYRPSRPQETIIESENEVLELMGRVDEGVEEFFTKRVLPADTLKLQDEESITVHEVAPASSVPCPAPTKTLRRKLSDFFTLKKRRGLKSETSHEGRPKKASIADLIRPLREVARSEKDKDKDRVKEHDKENEKEKAKEAPTAVSGEPAVRETPVSGAPPLRGEAVPPRRALREGKSQSLILLSGSAAAGSTNARNTAKKQFEGQNSFEQKLHLMLQRIGVSKPLPGETQDQEGEMKKAESEGTIIDSKPEPPPTFSKPRTMSASSDTRHQIRASVSAHEGAGKPALLPKPVIKPGPPPTTSGRNTPENELAQIQEAETHTPTKLSPAAAPSPPATTAPAAPTISNAVPDSTDFEAPPSSTVTPSHADVCTDSPAATSVPETTTTPTEPPANASVTPTSSESVTPSLAVTSTSAATVAGPSITTSETVSAPSHKSPVSTASTNLLAKSTLPEPNGVLSLDVAPAAGGDAAISVTTTASAPCTSVSDVPPGLSTTTISEVSHEPASVTSSSSSTLVTMTTSPPSDSSDVITVTISHDPTFTASSTMVSAALPPTTSAPSTTPTAQPQPQLSTDSINSASSSTAIHPATTSVPSTSSSETNPTDTTSTATSLNRAETTSTASSSTSGAISSPLTTGSEPPFPNNVDTKLTPTISSPPTTDNTSSAAPPASDSPGQDNVIQISDERSGVGPAEKGTADGEQTSKVLEADEKKEVVDSRSQSEKPTMAQSEPTTKEERGESVKAEADTQAEPAAVEDGEGCTEEAVIVGQKQEETKPVSDK
ncbi:putative GPI-anchored protein pfl2 isoform X2 [Simochromis diagramma]|uniref:putative GPI-anchored protein pfl2 isoform X2 n=1 Tax=Simochromis diagramma TaxID=43689 RepID=UPI001A7F017A|nr:putative GPI-anchored protein pfl2 isoform X2 [Simochromis diagramma]